MYLDGFDCKVFSGNKISADITVKEWLKSHPAFNSDRSWFFYIYLVWDKATIMGHFVYINHSKSIQEYLPCHYSIINAKMYLQNVISLPLHQLSEGRHSFLALDSN